MLKNIIIPSNFINAVYFNFKHFKFKLIIPKYFKGDHVYFIKKRIYKGFAYNKDQKSHESYKWKCRTFNKTTCKGRLHYVGYDYFTYEQKAKTTKRKRREGNYSIEEAERHIFEYVGEHTCIPKGI